MPHLYFIGVDVGTGSVRAGIFNHQGQALRKHTVPIKTWNPETDHYEQSSDEIWSAVCDCVKTITHGYQLHEIAGIGFDATCSLVVIDKQGDPLTVSRTGKDNQNVILWLDHRAAKETDDINATNHDLLKYVGGNVSLEMECPKMLWLKNNMPISCWNHMGRLFDLPDFLTWKSTGNDSRSLCSVVCKWNYDAANNQWSEEFLNNIGLSDLTQNNFEIIGSEIKTPGSPVGEGLSAKAAVDLGLFPSIPVGISMIDAHAGALALLGCSADHIDDELSSKIALICGTSSCHMSVKEESLFVPGIWGPYENALFPNMFLHEAGQSATGILLDELVKSHPAYGTAIRNSGPSKHIFHHLNDVVLKLMEERKLNHYHELTSALHIWPDFHGNRSPLADPNLRGMVCGLSLNHDETNLAIFYLAIIQSLAYGTKHILDTLKSAGRSAFSSILICGGMSKNEIFLQTHADVCDIPVLLPEEKESVLLGAAMLGACAAKVFPDLQSAAKAMGGRASVIHPNEKCKLFHDKKYKVFLKMLEDQRSYKEIMREEY